MANLKQEISQERPFSSTEEEAFLNLLRTADCIDRVMQRVCRTWGVTGTQYNVLRILRGAGQQGLTCSAIGDRMITAEPDITRLLGRLKTQKLIQQRRDRQDRRVVWTHISEAGLALLRRMDPHIQRAPKELFGHMSAGDVREIVRLMELARVRCGDSLGPVSCDGSGETAKGSCDTDSHESGQSAQVVHRRVRP
ncbi:MAG TPA: MarR family transcriptional regulator [Terracidiphilus sp.]|nr:MarR family transcriptional regulator [Terracidiphilus sp.]